MGYKDLRAYLKELDKRGLLKRVSVEVDVNLEITEITDRVVKAGGPALFFENVRGYKMPVVTNLFGTLERVCLALGASCLDEIGQRLSALLKFDGVPSTLVEKIKMLPRLAQLSSFAPKRVKDAPCKEVVLKGEEASLEDIPVLKCWPEDGGPFITLPLVITRDPKNGQRNVGMYRMQVYDGRTTGMHWHIHKDGAEHLRKQTELGGSLPVAVAIGADPAVIYAATAPLPRGMDEILFAGFLRGEPVEMVGCETIDLEVPAGSEIVLEGYVDPSETRLEGPFGDHTGFYSPADYYPVFHITCITRRRDAIYPATVVGRPPMEDAYLGKATERIFLPLIRLVLPEVMDINMPPEGVFHNCVLVSIKKTYPGQAKKVMSALWGLGMMMLSKLIIVVDEDVNVQDISEVMWCVFNNIDAGRDLLLTEGPLDDLDHSSPRPRFGTKMGIDATRKWPEEGHTRVWPKVIVMSEDVKKMVDGKWSLYGL